MIGLAAWYLTGMIVSLYWPWKYRKSMRPEWWRERFWMMFIHGFFGPFAIVTSFPI